MPLQATSGAASYDAFGGGVAAVPNYIEDVFSTYLYTGSNSAQTITTGIDLLTKGGLLWLKGRNVGSAWGYGDHELFDSANVGSTRKYLRSDGTDALGTNGSIATIPFTTSGFNLDAGPEINNRAGDTNVAWTFAKQPKFFDVVTWTGSGATRTIAHNLGSVPGCIIIKSTNLTSDWVVYHRSLGNTDYAKLNLTDASAQVPNYWNNTSPTSTNFTVKTSQDVNGDGQEYVAYIFAHDAGGFGLTGTDNVISCGSVVGASQVEVNLGYEPQWILVKNASAAQDWWLVDNMRGLPVQGTDTSYNASNLRPNLSDAETTGFAIAPSATGFKANVLTAGQTYIYIAIRRGPMKVPTSGTSVFTPATRTGTSATANITSAGFPVDLALIGRRNTDGLVTSWDRLRGAPQRLITSANSAESSSATGLTGFDSMTGFSLGNNNTVNDSTYNYVDWDFRRAPSFFDEVCFTASGSVPLAHNLGVTPELVIYKTRGSADSWWTCANVNGVGQINNTGAWALTGLGNGLTAVAQATSTTISNLNGVLLSPGDTVVAYLFASCPGVSKVTNFTGNGTSQTINCGFTSGARFVMIKATSTTGNWTVFDSARGISAGGDPALYLNSTAAEVTGVDAIDADSTGFIVNQEGTFNLNASGVQYLVLAIS